MLYTKSMKEYKNTAKAAELDLESGPMLKTWYESVRTKVGKMSDKKSDSATKDMSDRDTFLMQNFGFLASHIARVKGRPACSLKPRLDTALPTVSSDSEQEMEHDTQEGPEETGDQSPAPEPPTSKGKSCTVRGRSIPTKSSSSQKKTSTPVPALDDTAEVVNLISSLQSQQERSDAIQGQITGLLLREQRSATAAWGTWFGAMAANLDPTLLPRFYRASFDMMLSFAEESRQLQIPHAGQQFVPMNFDVQPCQQPQQQQ
ncbi:uncharacterized protein LOC121370720 [Gigantopelta aegis]|uniref:uncharacterized protein LOC121370720 n=1 Tax=Gigantopelta aegis TaxID=1735272 RepID=UPI001B88B8C6|nr:uncharacterized protein LOC121370720 [Gigantopelta aegis]